MERYEKYKDSGIAWLGEIPEHWDVKRMKYPAAASCGVSRWENGSFAAHEPSLFHPLALECRA
jgi:hypothetical protein